MAYSKQDLAFSAEYAINFFTALRAGREELFRALCACVENAVDVDGDVGTIIAGFEAAVAHLEIGTSETAPALYALERTIERVERTCTESATRAAFALYDVYDMRLLDEVAR